MDGTPLRAHLENAARHSPALRRKLDAGPELPAECLYVWTWFCELNETRGMRAGPGGLVLPQPLSFAELDAWARLTRRQLRAGETELLRAIDRIWLAPPEDPELEP